jgi:hypothetical protein
MDGIRIEFSFGFNKSDSIKFCATEVCAHAWMHVNVCV